MFNNQPAKSPVLWLERLMAVMTIANLGLVLFDLSYLPWRDFYLRKLPQVTQIYDPVKGIEPHREVTNYLQTVQELEKQVNQTGLQSSQVAEKLGQLRNLSDELITNNPFAIANKSGTLEKIKNRMRLHIATESRSPEKSAKKAFSVFWSQEHLKKQGWEPQINFFNREIRPLMTTAYYRQIGENGDFIDKFWHIDLIFTIIFTFELISRSYLIKSRHPNTSWLNAVLWRWYDLFLLIPFWRWLRVIPVIIRLDSGKIVNLYSIRQLIHQGLVANFAEELTEIVVIRVINQVQGSIKRGELVGWLLQQDNLKPYVDINNINEIEALGAIAIQTIVYQVIPQIQPEINAILHHNINTALAQTPIYHNLQLLPGVSHLQTQLTEQLSSQITSNLYNAIVKAVEDPVAGKLSSQLAQNFTQALSSAIQQKQVLTEIQSLLHDFLEEVKINYVQRLSQENIEQILEQTRQIRQTAIKDENG
ncbi:hypothetical protein [Calothrix sp. 336/3]|uniref:hypothetical protein n=1 Tax=Calothrix sp. 336/3 TaxID=1337936 RepID=UPI0004E2EA58|nr:hypothetical protein [Calothrix sp. 336/3]AKG23209.1 hypothetical protein IJ00_19745 [Calothrix sp. 336/3]